MAKGIDLGLLPPDDPLWKQTWIVIPHLFKSGSEKQSTDTPQAQTAAPVKQENPAPVPAARRSRKRRKRNDAGCAE